MPSNDGRKSGGPRPSPPDKDLQVDWNKKARRRSDELWRAEVEDTGVEPVTFPPWRDAQPADAIKLRIYDLLFLPLM